jgi:hypothetical protein
VDPTKVKTEEMTTSPSKTDAVELNISEVEHTIGAENESTVGENSPEKKTVQFVGRNDDIDEDDDEVGAKCKWVRRSTPKTMSKTPTMMALI